MTRAYQHPHKLKRNPIMSRQNSQADRFQRKLKLCGLCARALATSGAEARELVCHDCLPIYDEARANGLL